MVSRTQARHSRFPTPFPECVTSVSEGDENPLRCILGDRVTRLSLGEIEIAYEISGEGVSLLFIHQAATDQRIWQRQYSYFSQYYRTITVDVCGHGAIVWPPHTVSIEHAARCIRQLMEQLGVGPAFVIGVSMGAAVAVRMAYETPALVRGLSLVSPWSVASGDMQSLINRLFRLAEAGDMAAHADLFLRYCFPATSSPTRAAEVDRLRTIILEQNAWAVAYAWVTCLASDLRAELRQISVPSLIITGLGDLFTPPYLAREVAERLTEVELEIWEEAGHFPFLEDPERFNCRLEQFIKWCLGASGQV